MKNSSLIGEIQTTFESTFEGCKMYYKEAHFKKTLAHCFFLQMPSKESLQANWTKVSNFVALEFQNNLENDFERWNIYLFFMHAFEINNDLKYMIENDTFSSRKIIITPIQDMNEIINEHILNRDLNTKTNIISDEPELDKKIILWETLKEIAPKTRLTEEVKVSLEEIIEKIKAENKNEI